MCSVKKANERINIVKRLSRNNAEMVVSKFDIFNELQ